PSSAARPASSSGLREDMNTSCPALTQCRASAPPMRPVPMMPIRSGSDWACTADIGSIVPLSAAKAIDAAAASHPRLPMNTLEVPLYAMEDLLFVFEKNRLPAAVLPRMDKI